ncbi:MAG: ATP-dependent Clp protease adaptor ClpS [Treponema sp.]|nr:ATP-dependent Clp protease adaptor ClpS [Treponema sp.]
MGNLFTKLKSNESETTEDTTIKLPPERNVVFYNDDYTSMDFVTTVLISIFNKPKEEAEALMMLVHEKGLAVVGTYTYDIAVSRANLTKSLAKKNGFPLRVEVE